MTTTANKVSTAPSPMMVGGMVGQGLSYKPRSNPYIIRLYPFSQDDANQLYGIESVLEEFLLDKFDIWYLAEELRPKIHYHIYLESSLSLEEMKKKVRDFIYPYYPVRNRGFGNKQYNCQSSENPLNAIIYATKQRGQYHFSGFTEEFLSKCRELSFELSENLFDSELRNITDVFLTTKQTPVEFVTELLLLYSRYDKRIKHQDIQSYVNSKIIKRDPKEARRMAENFYRF